MVRGIGLRIALSHDGKRLAAWDMANALGLLDARTGRSLAAPVPLPEVIGCLAFSPDDTLLAIGLTGLSTKEKPQPLLLLADGRTGRVLHSLVGHGSTVTQVAFSPDGKLLAAADCEGMIRLWEVAAAKEVRQLRGHTDGIVPDVSFSPDGRILASVGWDNTIRLWEVASGRLLRTLDSPQTDSLYCVAFEPSGRLLACGGSAGRSKSLIHLWDLGTWREIIAP
jgi:WD40 repeat protein